MDALACRVLVTEEHRIDIGLVGTSWDNIHIGIGELGARLVLIIASHLDGLPVHRYTKHRAAERVRHHHTAVKRANEQVAGSYRLVHQTGQIAGISRGQAQTLALVSVGRLASGVLLWGAVTVHHSEAGVARSPYIFSLTVGIDLIKHMVCGTVVQCFRMLKTVERHRIHNGLPLFEYNLVLAAVIAVLRSDGVGHRPSREILQRAVGGVYRGSLGNAEAHRHLR